MLVAASLFMAVVPAQISTRSIRYYEMEPTPFGQIMLSRPVLEWKVWGESVAVESVQATIDGSAVPSSYVGSRNAVVAPVDTPLKEGEHEATVRVVLASGHILEKEWDFHVAPNALRAFPHIQEDQAALVRQVNHLRAELKLRPVEMNAALSAAAQSHAEYMSRNGRSGHRENPGEAGFTGKTPGERARAFGYFDRNSEAVAVTGKSTLQAVSDLFDAPYHRVMFLQPGQPDFGAGASGDATCVKFGGPHDDAIVMSPSNGATGVKREWDGVETPDPMDGVRAFGPYGYPIVLAVFGKFADGFSCVRAVVKDSKGAVVASTVLHPGNDEHSKSSVIIVPTKPLKAHTTYLVEVEYKTEGRKRKSSWKFTTA